MTQEQAVKTSKAAINQGGGHLFSNPIITFIRKLFLAIIVVSILILISKIIAGIVKKKIIKNSISKDEEYIDKIGTLIGDIIFYTLTLFSIFIGFEILGLDVGLLLGGLSFGIGLAFKEILGNMLAGVLILTTKEFTLGDIIKIESMEEGTVQYFGTIEEITIRYTVIREFNNQKVIIPNLTLITSAVKTFTSEEFIRLETLVSVHYNTDIDKAKKVIIKGVNSLPFIVNKNNTAVITNKFNNSGIDLKVLFYIDPNSGITRLKAISQVNDKINEVFKENNITIPYPHTVLTFDKNDQNLLKTFLFLKK